jgi:crossover junction endodeoxyribonuclease RusA
MLVGLPVNYGRFNTLEKKEIMNNIIIKGNPIAQKRHRHIGKFVRVYDPSSEDKKNFKIQLKQQWDKKALNKNIVLFVTYYMARPKSHYRTGKFSNLLKNNAPEYHAIKPDIDNLIKLTMDASTGVLWEDDCVVVDIVAKKIYSENPRTELNITTKEN